MTDIDGNVYNTIWIGGKEWTSENLKVTHYRNGESIPSVTDNTAWTDLSIGAGAHTAIWDGVNASGLRCASGIYYYRLRAGDFVEMKKMLLVE